MATSVTSTDLPKWVQDEGKANYDLAKGLTERPYQAYGGPRTAGFNPDQVSSFDITRRAAGAGGGPMAWQGNPRARGDDYAQPYTGPSYMASDGTIRKGLGPAGTSPVNSGAPGVPQAMSRPPSGPAWQPGLASAGYAVDSAVGPVGGYDIDQYMNPFNSRVIDTVEDELARRTAIENKGVRATATKKGQYALPTAKSGGSRLGVYESRNAEANKRILGDVISNLYAGGFDKALAQANTQKGRELAAAPVYADLGNRASQYSYRDAAALSATGGQQQANDQRNLDLGYADFLRQQGYPMEMLNTRMGALSGTPYESKQTTAADVEKPSSFSQAIGAGAALWGLGAFA